MDCYPLNESVMSQRPSLIAGRWDGFSIWFRGLRPCIGDDCCSSMLVGLWMMWIWNSMFHRWPAYSESVQIPNKLLRRELRAEKVNQQFGWQSAYTHHNMLGTEYLGPFISILLPKQVFISHIFEWVLEWITRKKNGSPFDTKNHNSSNSQPMENETIYLWPGLCVSPDNIWSWSHACRREGNSN